MASAAQVVREVALGVGIQVGDLSLPGEIQKLLKRIVGKPDFVALSRMIDRLLAESGSDKTCILTCQIYIADMVHFEGMNAVWDEWVAPGHTPPRATVRTVPI